MLLFITKFIKKMHFYAFLFILQNYIHKKGQLQHVFYYRKMKYSTDIKIIFATNARRFIPYIREKLRRQFSILCYLYQNTEMTALLIKTSKLF